MELIPIGELISQTDALMVSLGYRPNSMQVARQCWRALGKYILAQNENYLTAEMGLSFLRTHYHFDPLAPKLSSFKMLTRRAVMVLLEFQVSGRIVKRIATHTHLFPVGYSEIVERYIAGLKAEKRLKDSSIYNQSLCLEAALAFFAHKGAGCTLEVTTVLINDYLLTLAVYSKTYISNIINTLRKFFEYVNLEDALQPIFIFPKVSACKDRKIPEYYTAEEIKQILDAVDRANSCGKRNYAMLLLGTRYGLRISDIRSLEIHNIDFVKNKINIIQIKTDKPLELDLLPDVGWAIIDYIKNGRPISNSTKLFVRHVAPHEEFSENDKLTYIIKRYALAAGIRKLSKNKMGFHMLRFGLASELLSKNIPLTTISGILGHSGLNVTTLYTKIDVTQLSVCALEVPQ